MHCYAGYKQIKMDERFTTLVSNYCYSIGAAGNSGIQ